MPSSHQRQVCIVPPGNDVFFYRISDLNQNQNLLFDSIGDFEVGQDQILVYGNYFNQYSLSDFTYDLANGILSFQNNPFIQIQNNPAGFNVANDIVLG